MTEQKYMPNKRLTIALGLFGGNPFATVGSCTAAELNALKNISAAVPISGFTFGLQASPQESDRTFADEPNAQIRGFNQFGGDVPTLLPRSYTDTSDILQQVWTLLKVPGILLWVATRLGPLNSAAFAVGDLVNLYKVATDGNQKNTEGTTGARTVITFLPQGDVYPNVVVRGVGSTPVQLTGFPTTATVGKPIWGQASLGSRAANDLVNFSSSDTTKLVHDSRGVFMPVAAGTVTITASKVGYTDATAVSITVNP